MPRPNNIPTRQAARERRQAEAAERQSRYDALSQSEKDARNPKKAQQ